MISKLLSSLMLIAIGVVMVLWGTQCTSDQSKTADQVVAEADVSKIVLLKVGDTSITVADLIARPEVYKLLHEQMAIEIMVMNELESRGLTLDEVAINFQYETMIMNYGSVDNLKERQFTKELPNILLERHMRATLRMMQAGRLITKDDYIKANGHPTDEQIQAYMDEQNLAPGDVPRSQPLPLTDPTFEDIRDEVVGMMAQAWFSEHGKFALDELKSHYVVESFLNDFNKVSETESVEVPKIEDAPSAEGEQSGE